MVVLNCGWGNSNSNSYVCLDGADEIAANMPWAKEWDDLTDDEKKAALILATSWLDPLPWCGIRCSAEQALAWPRTEICCDGVYIDCDTIPQVLQRATVMLAYMFIKYPEKLDELLNGLQPGGGAPRGTFVSKQKVGSLEQHFEQFLCCHPRVACDGCNIPLIIQLFPWLEDWLGGCYLCMPRGMGRTILRVRS